MYNNPKSKLSCIYTLIILSIYIINFTQIPIFYGDKSIKVLVLALFFVIFIIILSRKHILITPTIMKYILIVAIFNIYILSMHIINPVYINTEIVYYINTTTLFIVMGYICGAYINKNDIYKVFDAYIFSTIISSTVVYLEYYMNKDWINMNYLYAGKNNISITVMTAIILCLYYIYRHKSKKYILLNMVLFVYLIAFKSRAAVISLFSSIVIFLLIYKDNRIIKFRLCLLFGFMLFIISTIFINIFNLDYLITGKSGILRYFINNIDIENNNFINMISADRVDMLNTFFKNFKYKPFVGFGDFERLECFYTTTLIRYGIIGAIPVFIYIIKPLVYSKKNNKVVLMLISLAYLIDGIFEQGTPLGSGFKCYFLWLLLGIHLSERTLKINNERLDLT